MKTVVIFLILCLSIIPAFAQGITPVANIQVYLGLTDSQLAMLLQINSDYGKFVSDKQQRITQVNQELDEETAKPVVDPMALGVRYLELEAICRQVQSEMLNSRQRSRTVLNDAQLAKLKVLEDSVKLLPLVGQAAGLNLLAGSGYASLLLQPTFGLQPVSGLVPNPFTFTSLLGSFSNYMPGCRNRP